MSVRISDPATVLGLHLIEIANFKKALRKLNRSRIPGIYLTLIDKFPDVSTFFISFCIEFMKNLSLKYSSM